MGGLIQRSLKGMRDFFRGSVQELRRVRWPGKHDMVRYTIVVFVMVAILTFFIFLVDISFLKVVEFILSSS